jgi:hypothetical protein
MFINDGLTKTEADARQARATLPGPLFAAQPTEPITGNAGPCARATVGHAAAPIPAIKSRRRIRDLPR